MNTASREIAVRATLKDRPAGILSELPRVEGKYPASNVFAALFNGARQGYAIPNGRVFFGKAEAEWGWPHAWEELMQAGLIIFSLDGNRVAWAITNKGMEVRNDDLAYFRELMKAMDLDEADALAKQEQGR